MLGFNCFASAQFLRNIFKHRYLCFAESRPSEKVTGTPGTYHKSERATSKFLRVREFIWGAKKYSGVDVKNQMQIYKEGVLVEA